MISKTKITNMLTPSAAFEYFESHIPMIELITSVLVIILIIIALSGATGTDIGKSGYASLIVALIIGISVVGLTQTLKPGSAMNAKFAAMLGRHATGQSPMMEL